MTASSKKFRQSDWCKVAILTSLCVTFTLLLCIEGAHADENSVSDWQYLCNVYNVHPVCSPDGASAVWVDTIAAVAQQECNNVVPVGHIYAYSTNTQCRFSSYDPANGHVVVDYAYIPCGYSSPAGCSWPEVWSSYGFIPHTRFNPARYFIKTSPLPNAESGSCCQNAVGEPINPSTGSVINILNDIRANAGSIRFERYYDSLDASTDAVGAGWNHSYSRKVVAKYSTLVTQLHATSTSNSSAYADPASACIGGFAELQPKVPTWSGATALYVDGNCQLTKGGVSIGSVSMYYTRQSLPLTSTPIAYDVIRDDGQVIRFPVQGGVIAPPPTTSLKLQQTVNGYTVTDGADNVELYDTDGRLISVASRFGVVQTMSYDASARLSSVTDNFGHQLTLSYDAQNKLMSVTRQ